MGAPKGESVELFERSQMLSERASAVQHTHRILREIGIYFQTITFAGIELNFVIVEDKLNVQDRR